MFSKTILGQFIDQVLRGEFNRIADTDHALTVVCLLLADAELYRDKNTLPRIIEWLQPIYGDSGTPRLAELPPTSELCAVVSNVINDGVIQSSPNVMAYLCGLLGLSQDMETLAASRTASAIYRRQLRVFHGFRPNFISSRTNTTPIVLLGLKGSGKSMLLKALEARGEIIHEIYSSLDTARVVRPELLSSLPEAKNWEAEPMEIGFQFHGWTKEWPQRFFIGSLLRLSEVRVLSQIGHLQFIYIVSPNALRHTRASNRGRRIESGASESWLVELDAHRGGEWPGYESNDLGSLLTLAHYTVVNDGSNSIDVLVNQILKYATEHRQEGR